jgi:predicted DsbA family dithiol-disulfide isomerase
VSSTVEVFADITCPFTHVGLKRVVGEGLDVDAVEAKAQALAEQLGVDDFHGLRHDRWPATTIPALNLAASGYERDADTGLAVSLAVRAALFEEGLDVGEPSVLAAIADRHGLPAPAVEACDAVRSDYELGRRRGVTGSPHFWVGEENFFCPALDLGHDQDGNLTARLDTDGLARFFARVDA